MQSQTLRRSFLKYFKNKNHTVVPSSSVLPHNDPTLLFNNAGMNQFKDLFLGKSQASYARATSSQKCVRVGGKHNDLDNVGHTKRHLTFFEMLGNFSFGEYFKKEAIDFAWEVATTIFGFPEDKLFPTVYEKDDEAFELWTAYVPDKRITRMGEKDNFWMMGETGPCGPCSELHYDRGPSFSNALNPSQDPTGERYLEFWNLVFMEFERSKEGRLTPLPNPSIDTGAGLERILTLQMGVDSVFETDVLRSLIAQIEQVSGTPYDMAHEHLTPAFRVIADHVRTLSFAIADGVQPGNVDRGYVLRKLLRRAVRYGKSLGFEAPFLGKIVPRLTDLMGEDFPELKQRQTVIEEVLLAEEQSFFKTLRRGGNLLREVMERSNAGQISGADAFKLKDTYGFPLEEVLLIAKDANLSVDLVEFDSLEKEAKERSKGQHKSIEQNVATEIFSSIEPTVFTGYDTLKGHASIVALMKEGVLVDTLEEGEEGWVFLDQSPFYAEMGGQAGDQGVLIHSGTFVVHDTKSPFTQRVAHIGQVEKGSLHQGDQIHAEVNQERRVKIANNHTATHLLHFALREVLGDHIKQAGSVVEPQRLRFDFSHHKALTTEEIYQIETLVNEKIRENCHVNTYQIPYQDAQNNRHIQQFFGEKYGEEVRVVDIDFSKELCGGTHTTALGTLGVFKIQKEGSIASGVRRIEACTGQEALLLYQIPETTLEKLASLFKSKPHLVLERALQLLEHSKTLEKELTLLRHQALKQLAHSLIRGKEEGVERVAQEVACDPSNLRDLSEELIRCNPNLACFLVVRCKEQAHLLVRLPQRMIQKGLKAGQVLKEITSILQGSGGGRPDMAQGVGKDLTQLSLAFDTFLKTTDGFI